MEEMKIGDILHDALKLVPYLPEIDNQVGILQGSKIHFMSVSCCMMSNNFEFCQC